MNKGDERRGVSASQPPDELVHSGDLPPGKQYSGSRKLYSPPRLTNYGSVRALTQTGSGVNTEGMANQPMRKPSERFMKENIVRIGEHPAGFGLYLYEYRPVHRSQWGDGRHLGVLAEEVGVIVPAAVTIHHEGYRLVDYALLGIDPHRR